MFDYLSFKNEKTLLIVPSKLKNKIREEIMSYNQLLNIKIMSIEEVKNRLFFECTDKAFSTLYFKYKKPLSIINTLLNYLYFIDININYNNDKIDELKAIKIDLLNNNLLKRDSRFIYNLKQYTVKLLGFTFIDKETNFIINELKKYTSVDILEYYLESFNYQLTHAHTLEDELIYVAESISKLLENNVDINNIKLCNISDEYHIYLKRIFKNYNIPINLNEKTSLFSLPLSSIFINLLKENTKEDAIKYLKENYTQYLDYIDKYINILNKYSYIKDINFDLINYELKNTYIKETKKTNAIEVIDIDEIGNSSNHIFVVSCNYNFFPKFYKDEEYLLDFEKDLLKISTSKDKNKYNLNSLKKLIHSSKNIYLSYKDISYFNEYQIADFLDKEHECIYIKNANVSYSENEDKIALTKNLDKEIVDENSILLNSNYEINYLNYNNKFKGFDINLLKIIFDKEPLTISYSSLNNFYTCPFAYLLSNLLNLNIYTDSIYTVIGNIMHRVVENCFQENFDFNSYFEESKNYYLNELKNKNIEFKTSELFFIDNIKSRTLEVVNFLKSNENLTRLNIHEHERYFNFNKTFNGHNIIIKGFIDKIIYQEINNVLYAAIIDLKTGSDMIEPHKFEFGLSLQLPFYTYLLKNNVVSKKGEITFSNASILGIYIHNILNKVNDNKTLKYHGYTLNDLNLLSILDSTYESSTLIDSLGIKKDGNFTKISKLISKEELDELPNLVENKIQEMVNAIFNCDFKILSKHIDGNNVSCEYCKYSSICYKTPKDHIYLTSKKGGNNDA